jgi:hypothetical protein
MTTGAPGAPSGHGIVIMLIRRVAALFLAAMLTACGSNSSFAPTGLVAGEWRGTIGSAVDAPGTITLQLTQDGVNVSGTVRISQDGITDAPGTLTGVLASVSLPTRMQFTVTYEYGPFHCQGSFTGTLDVTGRDIDGPFSGENCVRPFSGTMHVMRVV